MTQLDLTGVFPALVTPFDTRTAIDHAQLRAEVRRLEDAGVAGVVPAGSTGESATLTHDEHIEVIETVVDAVESIPVIAGTGSNSTDEALELSHRAADAGADGLLLISPYYNRPEQSGILEHYEAIADAVALPQVVYNVPGRTGSNISPETVSMLATHPNIAGYKAASGDVAQISEVIRRTADVPFQVVSGDDPLTLPLCAVGATGVISVVANVEPARTVALVEAALTGDLPQARKLHHTLAPLTEQLFVESNPIPVKAALAARGHIDETLRRPLTPLAAEHRDTLHRVLESLASASTVS
jgi:dihydrodipicolinate synthase (EC 4.2.1.52)